MSLAACGEKTTETMYLAPAELTKEEQGILDLLEVTPDQFLIYDFSLEDGIEKLEVNLYELEDGSWKPLISGGQPFEDTQGRIALSFTKLTQGLKVGVQSEHQNGATAYTRNPEEDEESSGCATVKLSEKKQVAWDEEIPLVVQVMTAKTKFTPTARTPTSIRKTTQSTAMTMFLPSLSGSAKHLFPANKMKNASVF